MGVSPPSRTLLERDFDALFGVSMQVPMKEDVCLVRNGNLLDSFNLSYD